MKPGDLVKVREHDVYTDGGKVGLVQWVDMKYPPQCVVMMENDSHVYDPRHLKVISEAG